MGHNWLASMEVGTVVLYIRYMKTLIIRSSFVTISNPSSIVIIKVVMRIIGSVVPVIIRIAIVSKIGLLEMSK